jgi:hypothetical protein
VDRLGFLRRPVSRKVHNSNLVPGGLQEGALVTFSRFGKTFELGRYELGDPTVYVSRGLGLEGNDAPRPRFWPRQKSW